MQRSVVRFLCVLCVFCGGISRANATDYWVSNGGSDAAAGTSQAEAWATLQHAADRVDPGDTVHVLDGSYTGFYLDRSGTAGNPITFLAEGDAVQIVADNAVTPDGINVEGSDYVVIDGFVVNGRTRAGIRVVLGSFVTVRNCRAGNNGRWGIFTGFADDLTIERNVTYGSLDEHGIYVSNSGDRPVIRDNVIYDNHANGIHMNGDASLGGDGVISGGRVERNVIYGNGAGGGSGINMDGVTDSVVQNNLIYDNHASGISLYRIDGGSGSSRNLVINNTIVNASDGRWCVNINSGSTDNTVVNNTLYNHHAWRGVISIDESSRPGFVSDYNTLMSRFTLDGGDSVLSFAQWQGLGYDAHSLLATPVELFVSPGADFHPAAGSPAVDAGTAADAPSEDLDGDPRPQGAAVDIGAYEAPGAVAPTATPTMMPTPTPSPSPIPFLVCDVAPVGSDGNGDGDTVDAGEFGDGTIDNADIVAVFRASLLPAEAPPAGSDRFSAMDAMPADVPPDCGGDDQLVNSDVIRCFERALLAEEPRYRRRRNGAGCVSEAVEP